MKLPALHLPAWARHRSKPQRPAQSFRPDNADTAIRYLTAGAVLVVAAIAAVVSFVHIQHLAITHGQTTLAALLLPVSIDGTVAASSLVMMRAARMALSTPWLARLMLVLAVAATLGANILYGLRFGYVGAMLSGWPAVAFIGCTELSIGMIRRARVSSAPAVTEPVPGPVAESVAVVTPTPMPAPATLTVAPEPARKRVRSNGRKSAGQSHLTKAERTFAEHIKSGTLPSLREVMKSAKVGQPRAREIRTHLGTLVGERAA
jgi:hypothetical protein